MLVQSWQKGTSFATLMFFLGGCGGQKVSWTLRRKGGKIADFYHLQESFLKVVCVSGVVGSGRQGRLKKVCLENKR